MFFTDVQMAVENRHIPALPRFDSSFDFGERRPLTFSIGIDS